MTPTAAKAPLRADALRNRERIVDAAREVFAAAGTDAPLDEIARTAGVGNATLYRHFPDRAALLTAVLRTVTDRVTERAQRALDERRDAFHALGQVLLAGIDERVGALCTALGERPEDPEVHAAGLRLETVVDRLVLQAQRDGGLRDGIGSGDLLMAVGRLTRPLPGPSRCAAWSDEQARRHLLIFLDGLRAPGRTPLPGRPVGMAELRDPGPAA